jgi:hypothetical protein
VQACLVPGPDLGGIEVEGRTVKFLGWMQHAQADVPETVEARAGLDKGVDLLGPLDVFGYEEGDVVRYSRGSKALGIAAGDYARVEEVDAKANQITVRTDDDRALSYDPRRLQGVTLYREAERAFAAGDRVQ